MSDGRITQQTWKVWVRMRTKGGVDFIEDIKMYDSPEQPEYVRGTLTLDDIVTLPKPERA